MTSCAKRDSAPIAVGGGIDARVEVASDPYQVLDELMAVVEELCVEWPERPPIKVQRLLM